METNSTTDCGCSNNECCTPKKKKPSWLKILSFLILAIALSIIFIKVFNKNSGKSPVKEEAALQCSGSGCDSTAKGDSAKPCCPKE